ncbi:hypothetical protein [Lysinibacillus contaminans]|nr:hypothetical protein [Lysinibacillus contaminans]
MIVTVCNQEDIEKIYENTIKDAREENFEEYPLKLGVEICPYY